MKFSSQQLSSGRWGIYSDARLLATVASQETCETILSNLSSGRKEVPANDGSALYRVPGRRLPSRRQTATNMGQRGGHRKLLRLSNSKILSNLEILKTQRSETALGEAKNAIL